MRRLVSFSQAVALLVAAVAVGYGAGVGIGSVISGTWMTRELLKPIGFTVSSVGAGTGELVVAEEPKEVLPPTVFARSATRHPAIPPEEEIPPVVVAVVPAAPKPVVVVMPPVVTAPVQTPAPQGDPGAEVPGSCLILQERYCRSGVRLTAPNGRYGGVGFLLPSGTPVFAPAEGIVNTSGVLTLPSGTKYHTVFFNAPTGYQLVLVGNPLRNGKAGPAVPSSVMVRVTNGRLTEMGPYNLIVTSFPDGKKYDEEFLLPAGK